MLDSIAQFLIDYENWIKNQLRVIAGLRKDELDDAYQEVCLRLLKTLPSKVQGDKVVAYCMQQVRWTAFHFCRQYWRRRFRGSPTADIDEIDGRYLANENEALKKTVVMDTLLSAARTPEETKIARLFGEGFSRSEVEKILGVTPVRMLRLCRYFAKCLTTQERKDTND